MFCAKCGSSNAADGRFCSSCGAALTSESVPQGLDPDNAKRFRKEGQAYKLLAVFAVAAVASYFVWNEPSSHSDLKHHDADNNPFIATKAYDEGADFYLFNRCTMYVLVDGKKYTEPGDEQNDTCTLASPADALKLMAAARVGN